MILREAVHIDIAAMSRIHVDTWRTTYRGIVPDELLANLSYEKRANGWHQVLKNAPEDGNFTYVAEDESGKIVSFTNVGLEREGDPIYQGELSAIYILMGHQRKGIERELVQAVAQKLSQMEIHSMLVWVLAENPACRFYEKLGGQKVYEKEIERGGAKLIEIAYGWQDTANLQRHNVTQR